MQYDWLLLRTKPMKISAKYKAISVTVPAEMEEALAEVCRKEIRKKSEVVTEALRLYSRARGGKPHVWSLVMPTGEQERAQIDYGAFADEWGSAHRAVYYKPGEEVEAGARPGRVPSPRRTSYPPRTSGRSAVLARAH